MEISAPDAATSRSSTTLAASRTQATLFTWGVWLAMLAAAIGYVAKWGTNVPSWDDWDMVPTMTGHQPITIGWLWSQHNEHRIPVARLLNLALVKIFGNDFRVWMYFNVLSTAGLAATMVLVARRVRGRASYADAFFPLLLLNWGQGLNFIWGWQVEFFASTVLAGAVLLTVLTAGSKLTIARALVIAILLAMLVMSGAHGVALVPAMAAWLALVGILRWFSGNRRDAIILLMIAAIVFAFAMFYFVGFEKVPYHPRRPRWYMSFLTALEFLTMGLGAAIRDVWPVSGIIVFGLLAATVIRLLFIAWRWPEERDRALGLLAFLGAMCFLAGAIGLGRNGFEPRYITLSVPALCAIYFVWLRYATTRAAVRIPALLAILTVLALGPNTISGVVYARELKSNLAAVEKELADGVPLYQLIHRHGEWMHLNTQVLMDYMPMLRDAHVGKFALLHDDPPMREISVPLNLVSSSRVQWDAATSTATCASWPQLTFALPHSQYVAGIRIRFKHEGHSGAHYLQLQWKNGSADQFNGARYLRYSPTGDKANWPYGSWNRIGKPTTMTFYPRDTMDEIMLEPDFFACTFQIQEIVLLVPADVSAR